MKPGTTTSGDRLLGHIGLFTIGLLSVAADRVAKDTRAARSSLAGRVAHRAIAAIAFGGVIVDRLFGPHASSGRLIVRREGRGK